VEVGSEKDEPFPVSLLAIPYDEQDLGWVDATTLSVFRALDDGDFELVRSSVASLEEGLVRAAIDAPGVYGLFGLPKHPAVLEAVHAFRAAGRRVRGGGELQPRICGLILCAGDRWSGAGAPVMPGGFGGNICELCLGLDLSFELPELQLLEPLGTKVLPPKPGPSVPQPLPNPVVGNGKIAWAQAPQPLGVPYKIWVMNPDGSGKTQLTPNDGRDDLMPAWSPDGAKIAFESDHEIVVMAAGGTGRVTVAPDGGGPSWSPDGTKLAFQATGGDDICTMNADGSGVVKVTDDPTTRDIDPAWSPDGTRIAFSRQVGTTSREIYLVNVDGSGLVQVTSGMWAIVPNWSPDGTRIVFSGWDQATNRIWSVKPDGTGLTALTSAAGNAYAPGWSPDGAKIVYSGYYWGFGIWIMNADGTSPVQVASGTQAPFGPDWQPIFV
jgi:Tol biopolymer transport system component